VIEDCLNGRRTVWDDPFKPGRNGLDGLAQRIEIHSPLDLVILMLGTNDFQSVHPFTAWHSAQGIRALITEIRGAPIEPGMPIPKILVISPPEIQTPKGFMAPKFVGADTKCSGTATEYRKITEELDCHFFDAGSVTTTSKIDGVHLDKDQHRVLGAAVGEVVAGLLGDTY
jgi:lysophospholipase L1-like esterase